MKKPVLRAAAAVAAIAFLVPVALADHEFDGKKKKRKSFFESVFGTKAERRSRAERRRQLFDSGGFGDEDWGTASAPVYDDPEPIPGFGMGNLAYALPRLQTVADSGLASFPAAGDGGESIKLVLTDKASPVKADAKIKTAVLDLYKQSKFQPLWLNDGAPSARAMSVLDLLKVSAQEGLVPGRYLPAGLTSFIDAEKQIAGSRLAAAQFDVGLSVAAVTYAMHMSGGVYEPDKLSLYHDIKPETVDPSVALKVLAYSPYPQQYLASLVPTHPAYALLKAELPRVAVADVEKPAPFPAGKRVKPGQKDVRIPELRIRLMDLGHLSREDNASELETAELLDKPLSKALKSYQQSIGVAQTGALDQATVKSFNVDNTGSEKEKIISNLERLRWLPKNLGQKHVFVNQAAFDVNVMDKGAPIWTSKVIVGRPTTQTSVFHDEMETVVFNPTWGMPMSILVNEYLGKLRRDPGYFDRIGYQVVNAKGKKVSSRSVNWGSIGANSGIGVIQPAGGENALGDVKFLFPNSHSIYMHDTPNRQLFGEARRAFSHGCVRVENPREFASVMLGWGSDEVDSRIAQGETQNVKLDRKVPVHLTYFTAWPDANGKIRYFSDIYERDKTLEKARSILATAFPSISTVKIVEVAADGDTSLSD